MALDGSESGPIQGKKTLFFCLLLSSLKLGLGFYHYLVKNIHSLISWLITCILSCTSEMTEKVSLIVDVN